MHLEALPKANKQVFDQLHLFDGFYLAGGTALALQIGHRISIDFDLFIQKSLPGTLLKKAEKIFRNNKIQILVNNKEELTLLIDGIKTTFLFYPFHFLQKLVSLKGLSMLGISEIGATKAYTIGRRGSFKDYVDLFFILKSKYLSLKELTNLAEKKFNDVFNTRLFLEQLIYLEDVVDTKIQFLKEKVDKKQLEEFFCEQVRNFKID